MKNRWITLSTAPTPRNIVMVHNTAGGVNAVIRLKSYKNIDYYPVSLFPLEHELRDPSMYDKMISNSKKSFDFYPGLKHPDKQLLINEPLCKPLPVFRGRGNPTGLTGRIIRDEIGHDPTLTLNFSAYKAWKAWVDGMKPIISKVNGHILPLKPEDFIIDCKLPVIGTFDKPNKLTYYSIIKNIILLRIKTWVKNNYLDILLFGLIFVVGLLYIFTKW